jgi:predicted N-acetyltransferase YhbS
MHAVTGRGHTGPQISVRLARDADAERIAQLSCMLGYTATSEVISERLRTVVASENDLILVAMSDSGVVGWLQAHASQPIESGFRVEIIGLIVSPDVRRSGIGRLLVDHAEEWARKLGAGAIVVRSNVQRVESHAFYPALGYTASKTQTVYRKTM